MSTSQLARRDMSYRKPVPKYIPSPPPAPSSLPPTTFQQLSVYSEIARNNDLPPLPTGWRDAIDRATFKDKWTSENTATNMGGSAGHLPLSGYDIPRQELVSSPSMSDGSDNFSISDYGDAYETQVSPPYSPIPWVQSPRMSRKRTLPLEYRPPTPPLPAYAKKRRLPDSDSASYLVPSFHYHATYPNDYPSFLDLNANQGGAGQPESPALDSNHADVDRHKLQPATSFDTQSSSATGLSSSSTRVDHASITDARDTWLRDTWYILPVHPCPGSAEKATAQTPNHSVDIPRFWVRLGKLGSLLKTKIMNLKTTAFSTCDCTT